MNTTLHQIYYTYCNLTLGFAYEMDKFYRDNRSPKILRFWTDETYDFVDKYKMEFQ